MQIREAVPNDAERVISLLQQLYAETKFLLYEPGEIVPEQAEFARRIADNTQRQSGVMVLAEMNGSLAGIAFGNRGTAKKTKHSLSLGLGVLQDALRRGIGNALLAAVESWATEHNIHRLELTVRTDNFPALALYERRGFRREGNKCHSLYVDGVYHDEHVMSKLLFRR